ncbi:Endoglucanase E precursor [Labilithrix luteola]|uniref:Endoglucanase E n=1 Tax=Labilithrix luteola TaxID=1391654 RepID=A0A0K1QEJ3_9BACT|nr:SGNH/GDSL hydrolase family protein [Labilithrix luteola]AKV04153.1 Endoglucanase E precursor [Labilithrix luteola]
MASFTRLRRTTSLLAILPGFAFLACACTGQENRVAPTPAAAVTASAANSSTPSASPAPPPVGGAPGVRFVGRVDNSDPKAVRFAWPGTAIIARVKGPALSARIRDDGNNFFQVLVDGEPKSIFKTEKGKESYSVVEGLTDDIHEIALYKRTEAKVGEATFLGFDGDAKLMPPPAPADRRIEFVGDSITTGYGNEGPGAVCTFNPAQENEYLSYSALTARALKADHVTVAWSGKTIKEMTEYWERTLPARTDSRWNHKSWVPQVVVLNVGTNNFATHDPGEERFVRVYSQLFARVRSEYPEAFVVCALGPMLTDRYPQGRNNRTLAKRYMAAAMAKLKANGQSNFEYLEFPEQNHADGLGCGFHPGLKTHKLMAERLTTFVHERLGW